MSLTDRFYQFVIILFKLFLVFIHLLAEKDAMKDAMKASYDAELKRLQDEAADRLATAEKSRRDAICRRVILASTCQLARPTAWMRRPSQRETQPRASAVIMVPTFRRTGRPARPLRLQPLSCRCLRLAAPRRSLPWQA